MRRRMEEEEELFLLLVLFCLKATSLAMFCAVAFMCFCKSLWYFSLRLSLCFCWFLFRPWDFSMFCAWSLSCLRSCSNSGVLLRGAILSISAHPIRCSTHPLIFSAASRKWASWRHPGATQRSLLEGIEARFLSVFYGNTHNLNRNSVIVGCAFVRTVDPWHSCRNEE